jgi:hypothetical protein
VALTNGSSKDSVQTGSDGTFKFIIEVSDTSKGVNITISVRATGYLGWQNSYNVKSDLSFGSVILYIDPNFYAIVTGIVRDSTTTYPLRDATVLVSLPGAVDSTTTLQDGSFSASVYLAGLNSLSTTMTITKPGFKTYRANIALKKGPDTVGTVYLPIDVGAAIAHITGIVTDNRTGQPIPSVTVVLSSSLETDSTKTLGDGTYRFDPNLQGQPSAPVTLTYRQNGYNETTVNVTVNSGESLTENVVLTSNWNYATITGTVRDSATSLPLSGAKVIVSLTGIASSTSKFMASVKSHPRSISSIILDSTTTFIDGSFSLAVNLVDLDSLSATMTVSEAGYKVLQFVRTFDIGQNNLGNLYINIDNSLTTAHITGYVTDSQSLLPVTGVSVYLTTPIKVDSTRTSNSGSYSFDINLQGLSSVSGTLLFTLNSYTDQLIPFSVNAGQTLTENVVLVAKQTVVGGDSSTARGIARSISLVSVSHQEISIHGVGRNETSVIVWQVLDSLGFPIDINHQDTVVFVPTGIPVSSGEPAYVTPTFGLTDGAGEVSTTINSGTTAGTIQLVAQLRLKSGAIVQASPVLITVDGGLPDQAHFSINSNQPHTLNFAGYDWSEVTQGFTVQAGDKYGNPVAPNTAVYFNSTAGVVTAAGQTDVTGHANATLYSGNPLPSEPVSVLTAYTGLPVGAFGNDGSGNAPGYAFVKGYTQGENNVIVADSDLICISGRLDGSKFTMEIDSTRSPQPSWGDTVHSGSYIVYHVHISDEFGNPLESGTTVSASVIQPPAPPGGGGVVWSILPSGLGLLSAGTTTISLTLTDNLVRDFNGSSGSTDFYVTVSATLTQGAPPEITGFTLAIDVRGRNTNNNIIEQTISGTAVAP